MRETLAAEQRRHLRRTKRRAIAIACLALEVLVRNVRVVGDALGDGRLAAREERDVVALLHQHPRHVLACGAPRDRESDAIRGDRLPRGVCDVPRTDEARAAHHEDLHGLGRAREAGRARRLRGDPTDGRHALDEGHRGGGGHLRRGQGAWREEPEQAARAPLICAPQATDGRTATAEAASVPHDDPETTPYPGPRRRGGPGLPVVGRNAGARCRGDPGAPRQLPPCRQQASRGSRPPAGRSPSASSPERQKGKQSRQSASLRDGGRDAGARTVGDDRSQGEQKRSRRGRSRWRKTTVLAVSCVTEIV